jgi:hypothetical protein
LSFFKIELKTRLIVDARPTGIGAVLCQVDEKGIRVPIQSLEYLSLVVGLANYRNLGVNNTEAHVIRLANSLLDHINRIGATYRGKGKFLSWVIPIAMGEESEPMLELSVDTIWARIEERRTAKEKINFRPLDVLEAVRVQQITGGKITCGKT